MKAMSNRWAIGVDSDPTPPRGIVRPLIGDAETHIGVSAEQGRVTVVIDGFYVPADAIRVFYQEPTSVQVPVNALVSHKGWPG